MIMKGYLSLLLLFTGLISVHGIYAEPDKEDHNQSPHAEALALVLANQQKVIAKVDAENWWHDVKERQWVVKRPFAPGTIDSTHLFEVTYRIDSKDVASWIVNTQKKSVQQTGAKNDK
jgi:hypothetical protein